MTITREEVPLPTPDDLDKRVEAWLAEQRPGPERPPMEISCEQRRRLGAELDEIPEELHRRSSDMSEEEVNRDVEEALRAAREA